MLLRPVADAQGTVGFMRNIIAFVTLLVTACGGSGGGADAVGVGDVAPELPPIQDLAGDENPDLAPEPGAGEFLMLIYNVAGLPQEFSDENPEVNIPQISPMLNAYDLVLVQEDFAYHEELAAEVTLPYQSVPSEAVEDFGDGLNRFSTFSFPPVVRRAWEVCHGVFDHGGDCLTQKGFSRSTTTLAEGVEVVVYNLHMDASGGDADILARRTQVEQLLEEIDHNAPESNIIIGGDTNLKESRPEDMVTLQMLLDQGGLTDSCRHLDCGDDRIDRILFRSSSSVTLTPLSWSLPDQFVDANGADLSDHLPVAVVFGWQAD